MSGFFNEYPYTDFHELNLDWIIKDQSNVHKEMKETKEYIDESKVYIDEKLEDATTQATKAENQANRSEEEANLSEYYKNEIKGSYEKINTIESGLNDVQEDISQLHNTDNVLSQRIDNIASLPEGSTSGDAELEDIRIAFNGEVFTSAGASVRSQVSDLNDVINEDLEFYTSDADRWAVGYITTQGIVIQNDEYIYTPQYIMSGGVIKITCSNGYGVMVAKYNYSGQFLGRTELANTYNDTGDYIYRLILKESNSTVHHDDTSIRSNINVMLKGNKKSITNAIEDNSCGLPINFTCGKNINASAGIGNELNLTPENVPSYSCAIVDVASNDKLLLNIRGGSNPRAYVFIDANNIIINVAPDSYLANNLLIDVPTNAVKCVINSSNSYLGKCYRITNNNYRNYVENKENELLNNSNDILYQFDNVFNTIGTQQFDNKQLIVEEPKKYNSWPFIATVNNQLVCFYSKGSNHFDMASGTYYKVSNNGIVWSMPRKLYDTPNRRENVTGKGYNSNNDVLIWERITNNGSTYFELIKYDGTSFNVLQNVNFDYKFAHIGDIISFDNKLLCFYNIYGETQEYGTLVSTNDGLTWTKNVIATNLIPYDCPTEIQGVYLGNNKLLAIGRKNAWGGTWAQFQLQSSDGGSTWSINYTNITDVNESTTSVILEGSNINLYYYDRTTGNLQHIVSTINDVWDRPTNWAQATTLLQGSTDGGSVNACVFNNKTFLTYYSGSSTNNGIYDYAIGE